MHLVYVTHNVGPGDGQGRVVAALAERALREGLRVTLVADFVARSLVERGAIWERIQPWGRRINLVKVRDFARRADRALAGMVRPGMLVHGHGYSLSQPHQVNTSHMVHAAWRRSPDHPSRRGSLIRRAYHWLYAALNARWEKIAYRAARTVVAVSRRVEAELVATGIAESKLRVIHNGVDAREICPAPAERDRLGLPAGPLGLFMGDLQTARKNLDTVLAALAKTPGIHLAVAGDAGGSIYPAMAERLKLSTRVHFLGFRWDTAALLNAVDFFVCPSRYEPFSLALLEAMACGRAVITARTVGAAELVTPACGFVLDDPDDGEGLAVAMRVLAENPAQARVMGAAGRMVAEAHDWDRMTGEYLKIYREIADQ